jgi:hypothetical protein
VAQLELQAEPGCASEAALRERVAGGAWRVVGVSKDAELSLAASIRRDAAGALAVALHVRFRDGRSAQRSLAAQSCEAAVDALALLVQMTLDAAARDPTAARSGARGRAQGGAPARGDAARDGARGDAVRGDAVRDGVRGDAVRDGARGDAARDGARGDAVRDGARGDAARDGARGDAERGESDASGEQAASAGALAVGGLAERSSRLGGDAAAGSATQPPRVLAADGGEAGALDAGEPRAAGASAEGSWAQPSDLVLGAQLGLGAGAAPALQPAVGVYVALGLRGSGVLRPLMQLELAHAWRNAVSADHGRANFSLDGAALLLCPVGWRAASFAAHGCGAFELARLAATGYDTYAPRRQVRAWASLGAGLLLSASLGPRLQLQLGAALLHPWWRDQFSFAPDVFYSVPSWRWQLKVGLAVRFL